MANPNVAVEGQKFRLVWAIEASGAMPAREFFFAQSENDRAKLMALFTRLADSGVIADRERFKKLGARAGHGKDLFEFKSFQLRILGEFRPGRIFVLAHGVRKKKDELNRADIEKALRILAEYHD